MDDIRITDVKVLRIDPNGASKGPSLSGWCLIRVDTNQDVWGLGEAYAGPGMHDIIDEF